MSAERVDRFLAKLMPAIFVLLILYLYLRLFSDQERLPMYVLEGALLGYFVTELVVKWRLSDSWRQFFAENWLKIALILPFLRVFRFLGASGAVGRSFVSWARAVPYMQKLSKVTLLMPKLKPTMLAALGLLSWRRRRRQAARDEGEPPMGTGS